MDTASVESSVGQLPDEMLKFVLEAGLDLGGARLGKLLSKARPAVQTPHYIAVTSRGVVPHLTQDVLQQHTAISAVYMGLEDFVEKSRTEAPVFKTAVSPGESALRKYTALPPPCVLILGPRRVPGLVPPAQNTNSTISISTSVGFRTLEASHYDAATLALNPDVAVGLADVASADKISRKRKGKSADRTHAWLRDTISRREREQQSRRLLLPPLFACILPLEAEQQQLYLQDLVQQYRSDLSGLVAFDAESIALLPDSLSKLPRVCLSVPHTPHQILRAISLGVDLITVPSVTSTSEKGLAFTFSFPAPPARPASGVAQQALTLDMWDDSHATAGEPLLEGCQCYTCISHHRAYLYHLLQAKEMLAWTLLQIHNFYVINRFFSQIRDSIAAGSLAAEVERFTHYYEDAIVAGDGKERGPRIRGYHLNSAGGDAKRNEKKWGRFENGTEHEQAPTVEAEEAGAGVER